MRDGTGFSGREVLSAILSLLMVLAVIGLFLLAETVLKRQFLPPTKSTLLLRKTPEGGSKSGDEAFAWQLASAKLPRVSPDFSIFLSSSRGCSAAGSFGRAWKNLLSTSSPREGNSQTTLAKRPEGVKVVRIIFFQKKSLTITLFKFSTLTTGGLPRCLSLDLQLKPTYLIRKKKVRLAAGSFLSPRGDLQRNLEET